MRPGRPQAGSRSHVRPPGHRARKRFGQHFLEPVWAERVVRAIAPQPDDVILEIGPGRGAITSLLLRACRHVVACEIDRELAAALRADAPAHLTVIEGDVLDLTAAPILHLLDDLQLQGRPLRVVGNLPYNVASPILFKCSELVEAGMPIGDAVFMVQREVADRLLAPVGTRDYGVLGILLRHVAAMDRRLDLPAGAFRPMPKVQSTVVGFRFHAPEPAPRSLTVFRALVRTVFTRRRKTLANALRAWPGPAASSPETLLGRCGLDPRRRPETLSLPEFVLLADAVSAQE